jgi:hypothetical protein
MACALLVSCDTGNRVPSEADLSTFGTYVNALDTVQLEQSLKHILSKDTSHWSFDQALKNRYTDLAKFEDTPMWYSRMGVVGEAEARWSDILAPPGPLVQVLSLMINNSLGNLRDPFLLKVPN